MNFASLNLLRILVDPRVTRVGRWLRKLRIDEIPQMWTVLRGEMSFVGPRPEVQKYVELYTAREQPIQFFHRVVDDLLRGGAHAAHRRTATLGQHLQQVAPLGLYQQRHAG